MTIEKLTAEYNAAVAAFDAAHVDLLHNVRPSHTNEDFVRLGLEKARAGRALNDAEFRAWQDQRDAAEDAAKAAGVL